MELVDKKYNFLKAIKTSNLERLGRKLDGGYVIDFEVIKKCNTLITFGLGPDWSFELDYVKANKLGDVVVRSTKKKTSSDYDIPDQEEESLSEHFDLRQAVINAEILRNPYL